MFVRAPLCGDAPGGAGPRRLNRNKSGTGDVGRRALLAAGGALALNPSAAWASVVDAGVVGAGGAIVTAGGVGGMVLTGRTRAEDGRAGDGRALEPGDRWHIGSNAKAMTAMLYARLVEAGVCRWGATLPALFPDLPVDAGWAGVTIEQAMSHAAGIDDAAIDAAWLMRAHADASDVRAQRTAFARVALGRPPAGPPGRYAYGNAGYLLIGAAIERAAGASWEEAMATRLFAPLGLASAGFGAPPRDGPWGHAAGGAPVDPAGIADNPAVMGPAGRVHLTLGDYARFLALYLDGGAGGGRFVRPDSLARLLTPAAGSSYAGGWSVSRSTAGATVLEHEGSNTLWHAAARLTPERGMGLIGVANEGGARGRGAALAAMRRLRGAG